MSAALLRPHHAAAFLECSGKGETSPFRNDRAMFRREESRPSRTPEDLDLCIEATYPVAPAPDQRVIIVAYGGESDGALPPFT